MSSLKSQTFIYQNISQPTKSIMHFKLKTLFTYRIFNSVKPVVYSKDFVLTPTRSRINGKEWQDLSFNLNLSFNLVKVHVYATF